MKFFNFNFNLDSNKNSTYASFSKRFASFVVDFFIVIFIYIFVVTLFSQFKIFGLDDFNHNIIEQEAVIQNSGTPDEELQLEEKVNVALAKKVNYIFLVISALYYTICLSSKKQATIGNLLFKIMVIDYKKGRVSPLTAFIRYLSTFINNLIYGVGYLLYFVREDKAFLQDIMSDTRVINVK